MLRWLRRRAFPASRPLRWALPLLAAALFLLAQWRSPSWAARAEAWTVDGRFRLRGPERPHAPIVIVAIDETSFQMLGDLQGENVRTWPRARWAELVRKLAAGRPRMIGLDVVLPATDLLAGISHVGTTGWPQLSRNCDYLVYSYYDPRDKDNYGTELYDVQAGVLVTGTLPPRADGAAFNNAGDVIAYQLYEDDKSQICTAPLDGSGGSCFGGDGYYGWPFWSPAGDWLLFYASPYGQKGLHLYRARPDGADLQQLTFGDSGYDTGQSWSPDGRQIAYVHSADHEESRALWVMNADGSAAREVLQGVSHEHPAWSPDSDWLVTSGFESSLWLVHPDGTDAHLLPGSEGKDVGQATWSPTPSGWPLFYLQYGEGIWYSYGSDPPGYLGAIGWGPVWSGDYDCAAFGTAVYRSDGKIDRTEVQVFTSEPLFLAP